MDDAEDRYYVLHEDNQTELMTLDELDQAFQDGRISEDSLVCLVGASKWVKLRELANLDEEEAQAAPPSQGALQAPSPYVTPSYNPAPARSYAPGAASYPHSYAPSVPYSGVPVSAPPNSMTPLAFDLDDLDVDAAALRPKRRGGLIAAGLGVLVLGGIAVAGLSGSADKLAAPVAVPTVAAVAALTPAALTTSSLESPKPAAQAPAAAPAAPATDSETPAATGRLTDDMKQALLAKDKERETKLKSRAAAKPVKSRKASKSGVFKKGGNAYDPLNGKL